MSTQESIANGLSGPIDWEFFLREQRKDRYDAVVIGGGPVGLWSAILTKVHCSSLSILIFEKRPVYLRTHTLSIEQESFEGYEKGINRDLDRVVTDLKQRRVVPIQTLEKQLLDLATKTGIQVIFANVNQPSDLLTHLPEATMFVGADGAQSTVRSQVFDNQARLNQTIHRLIQISYKIRQQDTRSFHLPSSETGFAYKTIASMNTTLIDERTNQKEDSTNKILTFTVSESVFGGVAGATFRSPFTLQTPTLPSEIKDDFLLWTGMKEETDGEVRILDSEAIVGIDGQARISKTFVKSVQGGDARPHYWFLVGDAAASFPLQRGFNVGIKCGIQLAKAIASYYANNSYPIATAQEGIEGQVPLPLAAYAAYGNKIKEEELCFLTCPLTKKQWGIALWKAATKLGSILPAIASLDSTTAERYRKNGKDPGHTAMAHIGAAQASMSAQRTAVAQQVGHSDGQHVTAQGKITELLSRYQAQQQKMG